MLATRRAFGDPSLSHAYGRSSRAQQYSTRDTEVPHRMLGPPELTSSKQRIETNFSQTVLRTPCAMCGPLQRKNIHCNQSLLEAIGGLAVLPVRGYCMFDLIGIPLRQDR